MKSYTPGTAATWALAGIIFEFISISGRPDHLGIAMPRIYLLQVRCIKSRSGITRNRDSIFSDKCSTNDYKTKIFFL